MSRQCKTCGKNFSRKEHLRRHMLNVHNITSYSDRSMSKSHGPFAEITTNQQSKYTSSEISQSRGPFGGTMHHLQDVPTSISTGLSPITKITTHPKLPISSVIPEWSHKREETYSIQLTHPFGLMVSGGTKTGKTTFVKQMLENAKIMIDPPPENIIYFYSEYQDTFARMELLIPGIQFVQGLSESILDSINPQIRNLFIIDDMMGEKDTIIAKLFTKKSHHGNLSVIYIVQNLFHQSKDHRTISLNASYFVLTKNVRDASQVTHLAKQLYPDNTKFFQQAYQMATKEPYSYLFVDLTPTCPDEIRVRSGIFPTDTHYVYQPRI